MKCDVEQSAWADFTLNLGTGSKVVEKKIFSG
jgi:hypothetical protein